MTKQDVQNAILNDMIQYLTEDEIEKLKFSLIKNMRGYEIIQEETALSAEIDDNLEYLNRFRNEMIINNVSKNTITQYYGETKKFLEDVDKNFRDIKYEDVIYYFMIKSQGKGTYGRKISKRTLDTKRKHIKSFFNWCVENEYIEKNPFSKFKKIKFEEKEKEILTNKEIVMLRDACENELELAVIDFLLSTGVRVSECCAVNISDIDFNTGIVKIYGEKTRKWRKVFLDAPAQKHIIEYLKSRPEDTEDALFIHKRKPCARFQKASVERITKNVAQRAGVKKNCTVHLFRRTLATKLYKKGMPLKDIAQILGNTVDTLEKYYIILEDKDIEQNYNKYVA